MFHYVYILLSHKDRKFYIGSTKNLTNRIKLHKKGAIYSTKSRLPIELIFYEAYKSMYDALRREKYLKTDKGKTTINSMLREYLKNLKTSS